MQFLAETSNEGALKAKDWRNNEQKKKKKYVMNYKHCLKIWKGIKEGSEIPRPIHYNYLEQVMWEITKMYLT